MKHGYLPFHLDLYEGGHSQQYLPQVRGGDHEYDHGVEVLEAIGWTPEVHVSQ